MRNPFILIIFISAFTASAHADYFKCEIEQMGSILGSQEAEYRVLEASVSVDGFLCEGRIKGYETQVKLTDLTGDRVSEASQKASTASTSLSTVPRHNELNIICTCGMN